MFFYGYNERITCFDDLKRYWANIIVAKSEGLYEFFDLTGKKLLSDEYDDIGYLVDSDIVWVKKWNTYGYFHNPYWEDPDSTDTAAVAGVAIPIAVGAGATAAAVIIAVLLLKKKKASPPQPADAAQPSAVPEPTPAEPAADKTSTPNFCSNCGTPITPGDKFCSNCGRKIK